MVLHPERDSAEAVAAILGWAERKGAQVLGVASEIGRLKCAAVAVPSADLARRSDLLVSLGGDGTMLRAMRLADRQRAPVLGVNLGKLGFLAEVDVPDLPGALSAIDRNQFTVEPRLAVDAVIGEQVITAFNDIAVVRFPGQPSAVVAVCISGYRFVTYAADAVVVATPTGSTAYSFSAGGPIVCPVVEVLLVTPAAPHSAYNRGLVVSVRDSLALEVLPPSGNLALEADGHVTTHVSPGDRIDLLPRPGAAHVVRLGHTTFYERARRKLHLTDSAEVAPNAHASAAKPTQALTRSPGWAPRMPHGCKRPPGQRRRQIGRILTASGRSTSACHSTARRASGLTWRSPSLAERHEAGRPGAGLLWCLANADTRERAP